MSQIPLTLATDITDIRPLGAKKIIFPKNLSGDDIGSALSAALAVYPAAPVIVIDTPDASVYYLNTSTRQA